MTTKAPTFSTLRPHTGVNTTEGPPQGHPLELESLECNRALLRLLDPQQDTQVGDIDIIAACPGKITLEDALDTVQEDEEITGVNDIRIFRGDIKSRCISTLKSLGLIETHLEGGKVQGKCTRKIVVDELLVQILGESNRILPIQQ